MNRSNLNSFFHAVVCEGFRDLGWTRTDTKRYLQITLALVEEHKDHYIVESLSGMDEERLFLFVQQSMAEVAFQGGTFLKIEDYKPKRYDR